MADGNSQDVDMETEIKQLNRRMYQVEAVLKELQEEICALRERTCQEGIPSRQR